MAAQTPTTEPATLVAGDTAKWAKNLPDHSPADGWALVYTWVNAAQRYTATAAADPADAARHLLTVAAATTATWAAGTYTWRAQVTKAGEVYTVASGTMDIAPAFGAATDARSHARKTLDAIESYLENANNLAAAEYEIAGRKLKRFPLADLLAMRSRYQAEAQREAAAQAAAAGMPDPRRVYVRFGA